MDRGTKNVNGWSSKTTISGTIDVATMIYHKGKRRSNPNRYGIKSIEIYVTAVAGNKKGIREHISKVPSKAVSDLLGI